MVVSAHNSFNNNVEIQWHDWNIHVLHVPCLLAKEPIICVCIHLNGNFVSVRQLKEKVLLSLKGTY